MPTIHAYDDIIEFIAGTKPEATISFRPSEQTQQRVNDLIFKEKEGSITPEEKDELEHFLFLDHIMRLAKARARQYLAA